MIYILLKIIIKILTLRIFNIKKQYFIGTIDEGNAHYKKRKMLLKINILFNFNEQYNFISYQN